MQELQELKPLDLSVKRKDSDEFSSFNPYYRRSISCAAEDYDYNDSDGCVDLSKTGSDHAFSRWNYSNSDEALNLSVKSSLNLRHPGFDQELFRPTSAPQIQNKDEQERQHENLQSYSWQHFDTESISTTSSENTTDTSEIKCENNPMKDLLVCKHCGERFNSAQLHYRHLISHSQKYRCHVCMKGYKQVRAYRAHMVTHKSIDKLICDICSKTLTNIDDYLAHLKVHGRKDLHVCKHCGKYFRDSCTLETHSWIHTGEKPYKCETCGKKFRQRGTLSRHAKVHQLEETEKTFQT